MSFPIFASSELGDFDGFEATVSDSSNTSFYDENFSDNGIRVNGGEGAYFFKKINNSRKVFCSTYVHDIVNTATDTNEIGVIAFYDENGDAMFRIAGSGNSAEWIFQRRVSSSWTDIGSAFVFVTTEQYFVSMFCDLSVGGNATFYINDTLVASEQADLSGYNDVSEVRFSGVSTSGIRRYSHSQCLISPFRILGARVKTLRINGDGEFQEWSGSRSSIDEAQSDDVSFISSDTIGQKSSYTMNNLQAGAASLQVFGLCAVARARRPETGPTNVKPFIRTDGDDYSLTFDDLPSDGSVEPRYTSFELNPATNAPWTQSEINAAEIGVEAE